MNATKDTINVNINSKIPFMNIRIEDLDVNNIVLNSEVVPSKDPTINSNFTFAYYMRNGKPHRFTIDVYGHKVLPIQDVSFVEIAQEKVDKSGVSDHSTVKRVIIEADYHKNEHHRAIIDMLIGVHNRILTIISRTPNFLKLAFSPSSYNQYLNEYVKLAEKGENILPEDFWYGKLLDVYSEDKFISKDLYEVETTQYNGQTLENKILDENGEYKINEGIISCFLNFRERKDKDGNDLAVLIDSARTPFLFDDVKGLTGNLGKMSFEVGMTNLMKARGIKIHSTVTGGFLMNLYERSGGLGSYLDDVDKELKSAPVEIPARNCVPDEQLAEYEAEMTDY